MAFDPKDYIGEYEDCPDKPYLTVDTCRAYGVTHLLDDAGEVIARSYPYPNKRGKTTSFKLRYLPKDFRTVGEHSAAGLFGSDRFTPHNKLSVTITEGEDDCLAVYQMFGGKYPVVAIKSATSAVNDINRTYDWLLGFDKIYLCFDADDPGQEAVKRACSVLPVEKVRVVRMNKYKDPCEYLANGEERAFLNAWYSAQPPQLDGIISSPEDHWAAMKEEPETPIMEYPYPALQEKLHGVRRGELVLVTAPSGVGKSEFIRELEWHAIKSTTLNIGLMHFEDPKGMAHKRLASKAIDRKIYLDSESITDDELTRAFDLTFGTGRVHVLSAFGGYDFNGLCQRVRYMVAVLGCDIVFLDHITIALQTAGEKVDVAAIDDAITRLRTLVHDLNFSLFVVSHINSEGDPRGSKNIKNLSDALIHFERDVDGGSPRTYVTVRKNRYSGGTGSSGTLVMDEPTGRLIDAEEQFIGRTGQLEELDESGVV